MIYFAACVLINAIARIMYSIRRCSSDSYGFLRVSSIRDIETHYKNYIYKDKIISYEYKDIASFN